MTETALRRWTRARWLYNVVALFPGKTPWQLARFLGVSNGALTTTLAGMDRHGFWLSEDERGGLWTAGVR
jgi:hypothetical protein